MMRVEIMTHIAVRYPDAGIDVDPFPGAQRPFLEKGPQINSRAWSTRYLRVDRTNSVTLPNKTPQSGVFGRADLARLIALSGRPTRRAGAQFHMTIRSEQFRGPEHEYGADEIQVLEGLEAVRKRPGMYIGSTGPRGLHHLVYEIVDNSVDEALAGYCDTIDITILADGAVRVEDNGRGIPVDIHKAEGRSTVEVVLTVLHAGGKFGGGGYAVSGGLHGVGSSVVNALSHGSRSRCAARVTSGARASRTVCPMRPLDKGEAVRRDRNHDHVLAERRDVRDHRIRLRDAACPIPADGVPQQGPAASPSPTSARSTATTRATPVTNSFLYEQGLVDYVEYLNRAKKADLVNDEIISFESEDTERKIALEVAMQWTTAYTESVHTYANTINTHEGGTHEEGFRAALTTLINKYAREKGILKEKDDNLTGDDVREGLTAVISIKLAEPQFEGQTKTKLGNTEAKAFVQRVAGDQLSDWFDRNPNQARDIIRKALRPRPPGWPPARPARRPVARGCSRAAGCPASSRTARARTRRCPRSSSSRVTRPAVRPCRAATPRPRRSSAARQDPQRREGPARPRARQQRGAGHDHRVRRRHRRGIQPGQGRGTTRSS